MCVCSCAQCHRIYVEIREHLWGINSFSTMGFRDLIQVISLVWQTLFLSGPFHQFSMLILNLFKLTVKISHFNSAICH